MFAIICVNAMKLGYQPTKHKVYIKLGEKIFGRKDKTKNISGLHSQGIYKTQLELISV